MPKKDIQIFEEFYKEMVNSPKVCTDLTKSGKHLTPEQELEYNPAFYKATEGMKAFIANIFLKAEPKDVLDAFRKMASERGQKRVNESYIALAEQTIRNYSDKKLLTIDEKFNAMSEKEKLTTIFDAFKKLGENSEAALKLYCVTLANLICIEKQFHQGEATAKFFEEMKGKFDSLEEFTPEKKDYIPPTELGDDVDAHPYEEKIKALIAENEKDQELVKALEDANKIIIKAPSDAIDYTSNLAEKIGMAADTLKVEKIYENVSKKKEFDINNYEKRKAHVEIKDSTSACDRVNSIKNNLKSDVKIDDEQKKKIKDIVKRIKETGIFDRTRFSTESGQKTYGMSYLVQTANDLKKAIDEKDPVKIKEAQQKYREVEKTYDDLIKDVKSLDPSMTMVGNVSSSREPDVPAKYRNDPLGVSRLTGLWMFIGMCDRVGMSEDEIIDDPVNGLQKLSQKVFSEQNNISNYVKGHEASEIINDLSEMQGEIYQAGLKDTANFHMFDRAMSGFISVCGDNDKKWELSTHNMLFQSAYIGSLTSERTSLPYFLAFDTEKKLENMLIVEKEDFDLVKLSATSDKGFDMNTMQKHKKFDKAEYARTKTTLASFALRSVKTLRDFETKFSDCSLKDDVKTAIVNDLTLMKSLNKEQSVTVAKAVKAIEEGKLSEITDDDLKILENEAKIGKAELEKSVAKEESENSKRRTHFLQKFPFIWTKWIG